MAQAVTCQPLTTEASPRGICSGQSDNGTGFSQVIRFSSVSVIPLIPHMYSLIYCWCYTVL